MTESIKIAILDLYNGVANQGMRNIKDLIEKQSKLMDIPLEYDVYDVRAKKEVPNLDDYDIYFSSGGPGSPFEGEGQLWEKRYFTWLEKLWNFNSNNQYHKKYAFFICHSFQMICRFFEVGRVCKRKSVSFGVLPIHQTDIGCIDPFFQYLPEPFFGVDNRNWQVIEPNEKKLEDLGAKILALEKIRYNVNLERSMMAIRFSDEIFATQFHPEADPQGMLHYFMDEEKKQQVIAEHKEEKYYEMLKHLNDPDKILLTQQTIIPTFLNQAIMNTQVIYH